MLLNLGYLTRPRQKTQATSTWQPTDLSSLVGWWDASDPSTVLETTTTGRVRQWNDKSGNNNHLSQNTATNEPITGVTTINAFNTIEFGNGAAHYLSPNGILTGTLASLDARDISIHVVYKQSTTASLGALISFKSTNGSDSLLPDFSTTNKYYGPEDTGGASSYNIITPTPFTRGSAYLLGFEGNSTDMFVYKNGVQEYAEGNPAASNHFNRFILGYRTSASKLWIGEIGEIVLSGALNTADRQAVEGYLVNKWGI